MCGPCKLPTLGRVVLDVSGFFSNPVRKGSLLKKAKKNRRALGAHTASGNFKTRKNKGGQ